MSEKRIYFPLKCNCRALGMVRAPTAYTTNELTPLDKSATRSSDGRRSGVGLGLNQHPRHHPVDKLPALFLKYISWF